MSRTGPAARARLATLAALQLVLVAAGAAVPSLHLGTASHHHVFCPDHERFEDEASAASPRSPSGDDALGAPAAAERTHAACDFSNLLLRPALARPGAPAPATSPSLLLGPAASPRAGHAPLAELQLAPKHSPPAAHAPSPG